MCKAGCKCLLLFTHHHFQLIEIETIIRTVAGNNFFFSLEFGVYWPCLQVMMLPELFSRGLFVTHPVNRRVMLSL
jgi:hypothetical protein